MMNSFNLTLSGKHFICPSILIRTDTTLDLSQKAEKRCPSILNDSFAGESNLECRSLLFITFNASCQSLLACKVSSQKSADSLMGTPLQVTVSFSLAAFKIFFFIFNFWHFNYDGPLCIHLVWDSLCFLELRVYFLHQFSFVFKKQTSNFLLFLFF